MGKITTFLALNLKARDFKNQSKKSSTFAVEICNFSNYEQTRQERTSAAGSLRVAGAKLPTIWTPAARHRDG